MYNTIEVPNWYNIIYKLTYQKVWFFSFIFIGLMPAIISIIEGTAFFSEQLPDFPFFGKFYVWPVAFLILFPILNTCAFLFYDQSIKTLNNSIENGIVSFKDDNREELISSLNLKKFKLFFVTSIALIVTLGYWFGPTLMFKLNTWVHGFNGGSSYLFYSILLGWFIEVFIIILLFYDFFIWSKITKLIVIEPNKINFKPVLFHPDNAAGLSQYSKVALYLYFFIFTLIIFVVVQLSEKFLSDPNLTILEILMKYKAVPISLILLFTILPMTIYTPLAPFKEHLTNEKKKFIANFNYENKVHNTLIALEKDILDFSDNNLSTLDEKQKKHHTIKKSYETIKNIPEWPFDKLLIKGIIMSIVLPIIFLIIEKFFL